MFKSRGPRLYKGKAKLVWTKELGLRLEYSQPLIPGYTLIPGELDFHTRPVYLDNISSSLLHVDIAKGEPWIALFVNINLTKEITAQKSFFKEDRVSYSWTLSFDKKANIPPIYRENELLKLALELGMVGHSDEFITIWDIKQICAQGIRTLLGCAEEKSPC